MDHDHSTRLNTASAATRAAMLARRTVPSAPPIHRGSMAARPWRGFARSAYDATCAALLRPRARRRCPDALAAQPAWRQAASRRRAALLVLVALSASGATALLAHGLPAHDSGWLRSIQIGLFGLLFGWVSAG
ncbi:MAG TPA: hypothetical protein VNW98_04600, partial [Burkholderiaceae bacterium]|nr:hypothetical protein [Burkholderiaceae bacterium]